MGKKSIKPKSEKTKISSDAIKTLLNERFEKPGQSLIAFEVANGTGGAANRWADAISFQLWPSKDFEIVGYEIKVSRSDWLTELKDPTKSEAVSRYCDKFYLVSPDNVLGIDELPPTWGWIRATERSLQVKSRAPKRETIPLDHAFVASLIRKCIDKYQDKKMLREMERRIRDSIQADFDERFERKTQSLAAELKEHREALEKFQKITGVRISTWNYQRTAEAMKAVNANLSDIVADTEREVAALTKKLEIQTKALEALKGWPRGGE